MKDRDAALKKSLKSGLVTDRLVFNSLRNIVTGQLRKTKANFFLDVIKQAKGNPKLLWKCIDQLSGKERSKSGPLELYVNNQTRLVTTSGIRDTHKDCVAVATTFNDYFINSVLELSCLNNTAFYDFNERNPSTILSHIQTNLR